MASICATVAPLFAARVAAILLALGICNDWREFAVKWLGENGQSQADWWAARVEVGIKAQLHLTAALRDKANELALADDKAMEPRAHILIDLHVRLLEDVFELVQAGSAKQS